jgi:hypothetical protein
MNPATPIIEQQQSNKFPRRLIYMRVSACSGLRASITYIKLGLLAALAICVLPGCTSVGSNIQRVGDRQFSPYPQDHPLVVYSTMPNLITSNVNRGEPFGDRDYFMRLGPGQTLRITKKFDFGPLPQYAVLSMDALGKPYLVIGKIGLGAKGPNGVTRMFEEAQAKARNLGADAICINDLLVYGAPNPLGDNGVVVAENIEPQMPSSATH